MYLLCPQKCQKYNSLCVIVSINIEIFLARITSDLLIQREICVSFVKITQEVQWTNDFSCRNLMTTIEESSMKQHVVVFGSLQTEDFW